jgi:hypothetical protein
MIVVLNPGKCINPDVILNNVVSAVVNIFPVDVKDMMQLLHDGLVGGQVN